MIYIETKKQSLMSLSLYCFIVIHDTSRSVLAYSFVSINEIDNILCQDKDASTKYITLERAPKMIPDAFESTEKSAHQTTRYWPQ
jgi:hypothetical protein